MSEKILTGIILVIVWIVTGALSHAGPATNQFSILSLPGPVVDTTGCISRAACGGGISAPAPHYRPRAEKPACRRSPRQVVIEGDAADGGLLYPRIRLVDQAIACHDSVRFTEVCISACTQWLRNPRQCAAPDARFFFHAVRDVRTDRVMPGETSRLLASYPPAVRKAILSHGGLKREYELILARELGVPPC